MGRASTTRVLVTGGTGFVGSHVVELLLSRGYPVVCLVRDKARLSWLKGLNIGLVPGDCNNPDSLTEAVQGVSTVIHLAGLTRAKRPRDYYEVNQRGTLNVLDACAAHNRGLTKFILISSLAAAGPSPDGRPLLETDLPQPVSDYGKSKLMAELAARRFIDRFPVVILRPSAVYGPRDRDMFELFRWASRGITLSISGAERSINLCFVEDLAEAVLSAMTTTVPSGSTYFVSEEKPHTWTEFREALLAEGRVSARDIRIPYGAAYGIGLVSEAAALFTAKPALTNRQKVFEASQRFWLCDTSKIRAELGFSRGCDLPQGLRKTWQWYRDNNWL